MGRGPSAVRVQLPPVSANASLGSRPSLGEKHFPALQSSLGEKKARSVRGGPVGGLAQETQDTNKSPARIGPRPHSKSPCLSVSVSLFLPRVFLLPGLSESVSRMTNGFSEAGLRQTLCVCVCAGVCAQCASASKGWRCVCAYFELVCVREKSCPSLCACLCQCACALLCESVRAQLHENVADESTEHR